MKKIEQIKVIKTSTIKEVLSVIKNGAMKIALVVSGEKLLGTVTDGDIREALLNGYNLKSSIEKIYNNKPIICYENDSKEVMIETLLVNRIQQLPILNDRDEIIGIEEIESLIKPLEKNNRVILMVGGLGTRLRPLTKDIPKPMLKVGDKPILETIILSFKKYGFINITLCVNYKSHVIEDYFGNGSRFGVKIDYVYENERMGTAGALSLLKNKPKEPFFVMNGDLLTNINFTHLLTHHLENNSISTMCLRKYEYNIPYGVVKIDKEYNIASIEEKPQYNYYVNAGIYLIDPEVLKYIPSEKFFDMPSLFDILISNGKACSSYVIKDYWLDIGRLSDYEKANHEYNHFF